MTFVAVDFAHMCGVGVDVHLLSLLGQSLVCRAMALQTGFKLDLLGVHVLPVAALAGQAAFDVTISKKLISGKTR